jgi:hypothetical protein
MLLVGVAVPMLENPRQGACRHVCARSGALSLQGFSAASSMCSFHATRRSQARQAIITTTSGNAPTLLSIQQATNENLQSCFDLWVKFCSGRGDVMCRPFLVDR